MSAPARRHGARNDAECTVCGAQAAHVYDVETWGPGSITGFGTVCIHPTGYVFAHR